MPAGAQIDQITNPTDPEALLGPYSPLCQEYIVFFPLELPGIDRDPIFQRSCFLTRSITTKNLGTKNKFLIGRFFAVVK